MESSAASGLRSRSRSKTPFLRSSCDHENCMIEDEDHVHLKSGRKTPVHRSTPIKQLHPPNKQSNEVTTEEEKHKSTRRSYSTKETFSKTELIKTSDYSSDENLDRLKNHGKEIIQNELNSQHERVSTSTQQYGNIGELPFSPIYKSPNLSHTRSRSSRIGSPAHSACSTDSSFAEQALADTSVLLETNPNTEHLPYRLYKMAGEYWNKYPKTDYTYSRMSKDRVELAPGQIAVPNMSRRSLSMFRSQGPITSLDELDRMAATTSWTTTTNAWNTGTTLRKRYTSVDSSDDETSYVPQRNGVHASGAVDHRWWITQLLMTIITTITTTTRRAYRSFVGPSHRYPYTERNPPAAKAGLVSRTASFVAAPFYWIYTFIKKTITTTVTTVTETTTTNHVGDKGTYLAKNYKEVNKLESRKEAKRSWWPWFLLLLLPFVGYGCYSYRDSFLPEEKVIDNYKPPITVQDTDLTKRIAALEDWALNVDSKIKYFDKKLSKFDSLDDQIEQYSLKYLQQNLIQILNDDRGDLSKKLKSYFDQFYMTKDQMQVMSQEIHERLISSWRPELDEDRIRQMIQEYLVVFERQQMELVVSRIGEYMKEVEVRTDCPEARFDVEAVKKLVAGMLDVYDADKTGLVDYALESAGGQIISTKCTELYQIKTKQYSILGLPVWWVYTSPRYALTPGAMPAECWAFQGFPGYLVVRTYAVIEVTGFSLEHMSRLLAVEGKIESAPKNFSVYGLHGELDPEPHLFGNYLYDANGTAIQYFPVQHQKTTIIGGVEYPVAYDIIELRVESNHGNPTYTCVYRFRVHGNPLSDIRRATEDSIRESET